MLVRQPEKYKHCHMEMAEQIDRFRREGHTVPTRQMIKTPEQIEGIRQSSRINIAVLDLVAQKIHEGMTTEEIDKIVYEETTRLGGIPAPLNYEGFPKSVCTSVNNQVCHGIPSERWCCAAATSSMSMYPPSTTAISPTPPVCSVSVRYPRKQNSWYRFQRMCRAGTQRGQALGIFGRHCTGSFRPRP